MAFTQQAFLHREDRPQQRTDGWRALFLIELCELRHVPLACAGLCSSEYVEAKTREDPCEIKESDQNQRRKDNKEAALRALRRSASAASDPISIIEAAGSRSNLCAAASSI
jgi:hypothetical protein